MGSLIRLPLSLGIIPIMIKMCAFVISTEGPQSGPKWRNLLNKQISRLRFAALSLGDA